MSREPGEEPVLSFAQRIDVPGDDFHRANTEGRARTSHALELRTELTSQIWDVRKHVPPCLTIHNSNSTPGAGTITSDPGNSAVRRGARPFHRRHVAMHEHDLFRRELFHISDDRFARRMRAELELLDLAAQRLRGLIGIERNKISGLGRLDECPQAIAGPQNRQRKSNAADFR